ncbi:MAG: hypothetical protein LBP42_04490 [Treponema sp.]|jgi:hypothetical protein|nr:hypothetical protein [Treponema sp.]
MRLTRPWTVYLIHHSHTDIGYTARQEKIERYHVDFISQAIRILDDFHNGVHPEYRGFVWQCENYWQIKNFYAHAVPEQQKKFEGYVKTGEIGLSGNYFNMTELIDGPTLASRLLQARRYADDRGFKLRCGMSADINGFAWGYADALFNAGITCLYSCLHAHHGMFPLRKKQIPFYWETPSGKKILVWNGEHYHFGNELGFAPNAACQYMLWEEFRVPLQNAMRVQNNAADTENEELTILTTRLEGYLRNLEEEGYDLPFVPVMLSGTITDNAPPNGLIAGRAHKLSETFQGQLTVKMVTLENFFGELESLNRDIPVYRGDWNDWWADGVGSTPAAVKHFREAQRKLNLYTKLGGKEDQVEDARDNLMLYAEHTWGYSSSVSEPWETMVGTLDLRKTGYAIDAYTQVSRALDAHLAERGEVSIRQGKKQRWRIINPHDRPVTLPVQLYVEFWEYIDGVHFGADTPFEIVDETSGKKFAVQMKRIARAWELELLPSLAAREELTLTMKLLPRKKGNTIGNHAHIGAEGIMDIRQPDQGHIDYEKIETEYFVLSFDQKKGILDIIDTSTGRSLIDPSALYAAFSGIYEITPVKTTPCEERRRMGRNRKSPASRRFSSGLRDIKITETGPVFIGCQLDYALEGTRFYQVFLKVYRSAPLIDVKVRLHKTSEWAPENLYVSLPFTAGEGETRYFEKTGAMIRPGIDQLPGTNQLFYLIQNGIIFEGTRRNLVLSVKDTPLVCLGSLEAHPVDLSKDVNWELNRSLPYAWVMNNFWETNFRVDLGGFYEFSFILSVHERMDITGAAEINAAQNEGMIAFSVD